MKRLCHLLLAFALSTTPAGAIGSLLVVTEIDEAGSRYVPPPGTVARYVTSLGPHLTFYESRLSDGSITGQIFRAPDLTGSGNQSAAPVAPLFFESDGVTPFSIPTFFHPRLLETESGLGLYLFDGLPVGKMHFFHSVNQGDTWVHQGDTSIALGGTGALGVLSFSDPSSPGGFGIRIYYQGDGSTAGFTTRSAQAAVGLEKYTKQSESAAALPWVQSRYTPTGNVFPLPDGGFGLFFIPQNDSYVGFAESPDGFSWTITRGASHPIVSTSSNQSAPDPSRDEITELSLVATPTGFQGFFTGATPGQGPESRSIGSITIEYRTEFLRADCNLDAMVDISDVLCQLSFLFQEAGVACRDANDTNDDGVLDLSDAVTLLEFLFDGGAPIPEPSLACGEDLTADLLTCFDVPRHCP